MVGVKVEHFSLKELIYSGQFFNFHEITPNYYILVNGQEIIEIEQKDNYLISNIDNEKLFTLLGLDFDTSLISNFEDGIFQEAYRNCRNIRIMKIDLFQTIISFVCSAAANQAKIERNIREISRHFGDYDTNYDVYLFPRFDQINSLDTLLKCGVGYRAKYILAICEMLNNDSSILDTILEGDYKTSHKLLMKFPGVGSKVANCICLFALNQYEAFPVDTWIKKIMINYYGFKGSNDKLEQLGREYFGEYAGYIQQYLFHYFRTKDGKNNSTKKE